MPDYYRNQNIDAIKGFLIICVLFGHSQSMVNRIREITWVSSPLNVYLTSFEMQFFSLISGYFVAVSIERHDRLTVIKSRVRFIFPVLAWVIFPNVILTLYRNKFPIIQLLKNEAMLLLDGGRLWFLSTCIICTVFLVLVDLIEGRIHHSQKHVFYVLSFVIVATMTKQSKMP